MSDVVQLDTRRTTAPRGFAPNEDEAAPYRHRPNQDIMGVIRHERDAYSCVANRFRFEFLLDSVLRAEGDLVFLICPIKLQKVRFEGRKLIVDETYYDRPHGDPQLPPIPLWHVEGSGPLWLEWRDLMSEERELLDDMVKVLHASIARAMARQVRTH